VSALTCLTHGVAVARAAGIVCVVRVIFGKLINMLFSHRIAAAETFGEYTKSDSKFNLFAFSLQIDFFSHKLEYVAIVNALQLEAAERHASPFPL